MLDRGGVAVGRVFLELLALVQVGIGAYPIAWIYYQIWTNPPRRRADYDLGSYEPLVRGVANLFGLSILHHLAVWFSLAVVTFTLSVILGHVERTSADLYQLRRRSSVDRSSERPEPPLTRSE